VKVEAAKRFLNSVNPEVEVIPIAKRVDAAGLAPLVSQANVVLDCTDNFATRHAINRACVAHAKPLVSGAAIRFDGQLAVFDLSKTHSPCYACLFPEDAQVEEVQCSTMGVFAPLTGVIGAAQAMEALKLLAGVGESLNGKLQVLDSKSAEWRTVRVMKDPACGICSKRADSAAGR
jgi:molybdopterin-synthase adenylyltransferase